MNINYKNEHIYSNSIWNTATPSSVAQRLPLYGLEAGRFYTQKDYMVSRKYHDSFLLLYCLNGTGEIITEGKKFNLEKGYAIIVDCHNPHEYAAMTDKWEFLWLHFNGSAASELYEIIYEDFYAPVLLSKSSEVTIETIVNSFFIQSISSLMETSIQIQKVLHTFLNEAPNSLTEKVSENTLNHVASDTFFYIEKHYMEDINIDTLSSYVNLSKYYYIRIFKRMTGMTPYAYLTNYRITQSKRLLLESDKSIDSIAHLCGFSDTANYIQKFKKSNGISPLNYRKSFNL